MLNGLACTVDRVEITPRKPVPLAGFRARTGPFGHIADPLEINAALFVHGRRKLLVVAGDLLYFGPVLTEHIERYAQARLGVAPKDVLLAASHTHFAPATDPTKHRLGALCDSYLDMVCSRASDLLDRIFFAEPEAITISRGSATSDHAINRRRHWRWPTLTRSKGLRFGGIVMAPNPSGATDRAIRVWRLDGLGGRPMAVLWNYACHPVGFPDGTAVSADFPGVVRQHVRAALGADVAVLYLQGFSGDIRPRTPAPEGPKARLSAVLRGPRFGAFSAAQWESWASSLAERVSVALTEAAPRRLSEGPPESAAVSFPLSQIVHGPSAPRQIAIKRLRISTELDLVGVEAEVSCEMARRLPSNAAPIGCVGDVFGYLPTDAQVQEGGYEGGDFLTGFNLAGRFKTGIEATFTQSLAGLSGIEAPPAPANPAVQ